MKKARPSRQRGSPEELARLATKSIEKGDLEAALRSLEESERRGRRLESVRKRLALAFSERALSPGTQDRAERIAFQREACSLTPRDPRVWRNLGRLLYILEDYAGALEAYDEAERTGDEIETIGRLRSLAHLRTRRAAGTSKGGKQRTAPREIAMGVWGDGPPESAMAGAIASIVTRGGKAGAAQIETLLEEDPSLPPMAERNAHHYLGRLLLQGGRPGDALPHLREAVKIEEKVPALPQRSRTFAIRALLEVAFDTGQPSEARDLLAEAEGIGSQTPGETEMIASVRRALLRRLLARGQVQDALPILVESRKRDRLCPYAEKDLALAQEQAGEADKAIRHWERAIRMGKKQLHGDRGDTSIHRFLVASLRHAARLDRQMGRTAAAARKLSFSLQLDPERMRERVELAEMLLGLGRYREAFRCLSPIEDDPEAGPEVWTQMGIACDRLGQTEKAAALWERASADHPLARRLLLARIHETFLLRFRAGDLEGARGEVDRAQAIDPDDRDGILDRNCLAFACNGSGTSLDLAEAEAAAPLGGSVSPIRRGGEFSVRPEVASNIGPPVQSICCRDGTRCEAVSALLLRLSAEEGARGAGPIRRALLEEGCRIVSESLSTALEEDEMDGGG